MKTLKEILKIKDKICDLANKLGFTDLRIFCVSNLSKENIDLTIIVNNIPDRVIPLENSDYLEALLIDKLQCNIKIKVFNRIIALYQGFHTENSVPMSDENKLLKTFGVGSPELVKFKSVNEETYEDAAFTALLTSAKDYLKQSVDLTKKHSSTEKVDHYSRLGSAVQKESKEKIGNSLEEKVKEAPQKQESESSSLSPRMRKF